MHDVRSVSWFSTSSFCILALYVLSTQVSLPSSFVCAESQQIEYVTKNIYKTKEDFFYFLVGLILAHRDIISPQGHCWTISTRLN